MRLIFLSILLALILPISAYAQSKNGQPNILWLIGEDLGPELSCYGHPEVQTPNLDRLAASGVRYLHAFSTAPVCSPSRSAFMTGMYQTSIGAHNHRSHRDDGYTLPEGVKVITDRLRDAQYFTANIRDISGDPSEKFFRGTGKTDWNFSYTGKPFDSDKWADLKGNQPFYAQINFSETHRGTDWNEAHLHIDKPADPEKVVFPPYYPDHPEVRKDWAQYLNAAMALDKKIGYVLRKLEEDGLADNTVIIFMGDHGRAMIRGKQWPYESGLSIPLIISWPQNRNFPLPAGFVPGSVNDQLVQTIDISATTLDIAGITPPLIMQGRVIFGVNAAPPRQFAFGGRDRCDETVDRIRTVRDSRFRYIRNFYPERPFFQLNRYKEHQYPVIKLMRGLYAEGKLTPDQAYLFNPTRPAEELYDLQTDPYEIHNLAGDLLYRQKLEELRSVLDAWVAETNDQGRIPEPPEIPAYWEEQAKKNHEKK
ncbi:MAG: sulfatase [Bacteroidia bacterium]